MANRAPHSNSVNVDAAAAAFRHVNIGERPTPPMRAPAPGSAPTLGRPGAPALGGLAVRRLGGRNVPRMDLGLQNAGLGSGRPTQGEDEPPRRMPPSTFSTPFANFDKIV